VTKQHSKNL